MPGLERTTDLASWTTFHVIQTIAIQLASINQPSIASMSGQRIGFVRGYLEGLSGMLTTCGYVPAEGYPPVSRIVFHPSACGARLLTSGPASVDV